MAIIALAICSLLVGFSWAGPIDPRIVIPRHTGLLDGRSYKNLVPRELFPRSEFIDPVFPRSDANSSSNWAVTAVVCIILLICILAVILVMVRRNRTQKKDGPDEELGFGKNPQTQPNLMPPPKTYDGTTASPPSKGSSESDSPRKRLRPPLLTISSPLESPQESIASPTATPARPPAPPVSPRLIQLPPSPRPVGLPASPRLPISPGLSVSPRMQQQFGFERSNSPKLGREGLLSPRYQPSPRRFDDDQGPNTPLSAGGIERMMTQMEVDLHRRA